VLRPGTKHKFRIEYTPITYTAQKTIAEAVDRLSGARTCTCKDALATAIITPAPLVPEQTKKDLAPIIGKYMK